jgi:hypothetical protein
MKFSNLAASVLLMASINALAQDAPPVPKYLELARELVATVKPENNKYMFNGPEGVRWKGDLFTNENSVNAACSSFVQAVFERANDPTIYKVRSFVTGRSKYTRAPDWYAASINGSGLKKVETLNEVKPGDLFIFVCNDSCTTSQGNAQGHITIVDMKPQKADPKNPIVEGTEQWELTIIDSADAAHDRNDTRFVPKGEKKITGVGRGTYRIYTDAAGVPVGYTNGFGTKYNAIATRPIVISRPQY